MDILLHICCGPCLIYPFRRLKDQGFKISGFYYNPNLYPVSEYHRRVEALEVLRQEFSLSVEYPEHKESDFFQAINTPEVSERLRNFANNGSTSGAKISVHNELPRITTALCKNEPLFSPNRVPDKR